ncbi:hypothetical protein HMPREF3208_00036 [Gardnerella vaginalis]|uniref:Uncharacterized protein n=1 Tax=Gardnerella vaginalis TaxID=2702 RepID=A0A133P357_GARVA|nr:hypothetical protein HMPREF3208_00036 [Gardnerella vaginalis]
MSMNNWHNRSFAKFSKFYYSTILLPILRNNYMLIVSRRVFNGMYEKAY